MDYSAYINLEQFDEEAQKELKNFIDFLVFKYKGKRHNSTRRSVKKFNSLSLDTRGYKFNREDANER